MKELDEPNRALLKLWGKKLTEELDAWVNCTLCHKPELHTEEEVFLHRVEMISRSNPGCSCE